MKPLNLFYEEPDPDRWVWFDRYPRKLVRRLVRGRPRVGGQQRVFLNLCAGLDELRMPYRINDYRYIEKHAGDLACIIGKPHVLERREWRNPILFGPATFSHPVERPAFFAEHPTVRKILVPGDWMRQMWIEHYPADMVEAWAVGIDTELWSPLDGRRSPPRFDFLLYDKVMWNRERKEPELLQPIRETLRAAGLTAAEIRYGHYHEEQFRHLLHEVRGMIFLCEHETQGIAYQQALASGVPILAWDGAGFWEDPECYPDRVRYKPVSSVPYWDERCGLKFAGMAEFKPKLDQFLSGLDAGRFSPRQYIVENLSLADCARRYVDAVQRIIGTRPQ